MNLNLNLKKILASLIFILSFAAGAAAQSSSVTGTMPDNGGSLPSTCQVGYIYSKTSAVGGAIGLYFCNPANVLTAFPFTSNPFTSGGITINKIPKSDGASGLADGSCTDNTNITCTGVVLTANGAVGAPAYSFSGSPTYGWWLNGTVVELSIAGAAKAAFVNQNLQMGSNGFILFTSTTDPNGTPDTMLTRKGAANFRLGSTDVNGAPVSQTLSVQNAITGTDLAGSTLTIDAPLGTGAGAGASTKINRAQILATGATAQTSANAFVVCETKILSNTSATTTTIATIGLASNAGGGVSVFHSLTATDATNFDSETQSYSVSYVNKAGVITVGTAAITASTAANNSGSATIGATITGVSPTISLKVTPVYTTIVPTTVTLYTTIINHGAGAVACQ